MVVLRYHGPVPGEFMSARDEDQWEKQQSENEGRISTTMRDHRTNNEGDGRANRTRASARFSLFSGEFESRSPDRRTNFEWIGWDERGNVQSSV